MRTSVKDNNTDEIYHSYYRCAEILGYPSKETINWYLEAFKCSKRVEPLIRLTKYYMDIQEWLLAYMYIQLACKLPYPKTILFIDKYAYDYKRWHLLGVLCKYVNEYSIGKKACIIALEQGKKIKN